MPVSIPRSRTVCTRASEVGLGFDARHDNGCWQTASSLLSHSTRDGAALQLFTRQIIHEGTMYSNGYCAGFCLRASRLRIQRVQPSLCLGISNLKPCCVDCVELAQNSLWWYLGGNPFLDVPQSSLIVDGLGKVGWSQGAVHYGSRCVSPATAPHNIMSCAFL